MRDALGVDCRSAGRAGEANIVRGSFGRRSGTPTPTAGFAPSVPLCRCFVACTWLFGYAGLVFGETVSHVVVKPELHPPVTLAIEENANVSVHASHSVLFDAGDS